jgi:CheY-like chemotaxis protein
VVDTEHSKRVARRDNNEPQSEASLDLADVEMSKAPLISIVDDDALARDGIRELIESLGYKAVTFISAEHFLMSGLIAQTTCLITDLQMQV